MSRQGVKSKKLALLAEIKKRKDVLFSNALDVKTKSAKEQCWTEILEKAQILQLAGPTRKWTYARDHLFEAWKTSALAKRASNRKSDIDEIDNAIYDIMDNSSDIKVKDEISISDNFQYGISYSTPVINYEESTSRRAAPVKVRGRKSLLQPSISVPPKKRGRPSLPAAHIESAMETDEHERFLDLISESPSDAPPSSTMWQNNSALLENAHNQSSNHIDDDKDLKQELLQLEIYHRRLHCLKLERQLNLPPSHFTENILNDSLINLSHSFSGGKKRKLQNKM